jgi:uncharacterized protein YndB with AHSA1/START domain
MINNLQFDFRADKENARVSVTREFAAPVKNVWAAWTQPELLDQWWAPKPWKAETKSMDFTEGGRWLYSMVGPEGERHWSCADYEKISAEKSFTGLDAFCDENGVYDPSFGRTHWSVEFVQEGDHTTVNVALQFASPEDLEKHIGMGFREGFTAALENLDELLAK